MSDLFTFCQRAKLDHRKLLAVYLTVGFPQPGWTIPLAQAILDAGADLIELGIPFSDPLADGPSIQQAAATALRAGFQRRHVWETATALKDSGPVLLMGYLNNFLAAGRERLVIDCQQSRVQGLIIPDLPIDEEPELWHTCAQAGIPIIPFVSPTSPAERMQLIDALHAPFVYAVSITGVTGARQTLGDDVLTYLARVRQTMQTPLLVGFGVSSPEMATQLGACTDGVIVGSAVIDRIRNASALAAAIDTVGNFVGNLRAALDSVPEPKQALSC